MKAVVYTEYGSPDVLRLEEIAKPNLKDDEVLVKVYAAALNAADWRALRASPFIARLDGGLLKPKRTILGTDIAGRVEAVGSKVTQFQPGDAVFGDLFACGWGAFAEYRAIPEKALSLKPARLSFEEAAAVPMAAVTALQGLRDKGKIQRGQKVLINGASGGVGTFAVQLAKYYDAEVTAVCSTKKLDMMRSLGADHVIDYTREDFTQNGQRYDLIFDTAASHSVADYKRALNDNGVCVIAGFSSMSRLLQHIALGLWVSKTGRKQIGIMGTYQPNAKDLVFLSELLETGKVIPVIDQCYPLELTAEAIRYLEAGRARGKVVITVGQGGDGWKR